MQGESVAVVVVTYNSATLLTDFVASLAPGLDGLDWHLTVVDNDSSDDTVTTVRALAPDALVIEMGANRGYAAGINAGVAKAREHTSVLVLNPDVRLGPRCVAELMIALRQPGTGIAVPRLVDGTGALVHSMRREPSVTRLIADALIGAERAGQVARLGEVVSDGARYEVPTVTDWAEGSTMLVAKDCWEVCGAWDETFFLYSEETEFALRAGDAGYATRYVPSALAVHLGGDSTVSPALWALVATNKVLLFGRRAGRVRTAAFYGVMIAREASRAALGRRRSRVALRALLKLRHDEEPRGPEWLRHHA